MRNSILLGRYKSRFATNGTMKGNIDVTNTGTFWSIFGGDSVTYGVGQGIIMTKDPSGENVSYTFVYQYTIIPHRSIAKVDASLYEVLLVDNLVGKNIKNSSYFLCIFYIHQGKG
jgi:hypothetical protein